MQPFVSISSIIKEFDLYEIYLPKKADEIHVYSFKIDRPGLHFCGFYEYFDNKRVQILGGLEYRYLKSLDDGIRFKKFLDLCKKKIPAIVLTNNEKIFPELLKAAKLYGIAILKTCEDTSIFTSYLTNFLNKKLGQKIGIHGVFIEVCGEGVLIVGKSGVGKSETAMELIKRGHKIVADDEVKIMRAANKTLIGWCPKNIRHFMELRGIGIVNVKKLYGIGAIKDSERLDMIVNLKQWDQDKYYDRTGLKTEYQEILDVKVPKYTIPIKTGRNLAIIIEVAAMNNRQKKLGYDAAKDLFSGLGLI